MDLMDWYFSRESDDLIVPYYQEASEILCTDATPLPDWLRWGVPTFGNFELPKKYSVKATTNPITKEFNFDEQRSCNTETSVHKRKGSSNSSLCGEFSLADYSAGNPEASLLGDRLNYQLQNLYKSVNNLGSNSIGNSIPDMENQYQTMCLVPDVEYCSVPFDDLFTEMHADSWSLSEDSSCMDSSMHHIAGGFPLSTDDSLDGWYQVEDDPPPHLVQSDPKNTQGSPNIKSPVRRVLIPAELNLSNETDMAIGEEKSREVTGLQELELAMTQLNQETRICFRDALYRLARSSKQQHTVDQSASAELIMDNKLSISHTKRMRIEGQKSTETETNAIDRTIASLMFNKLNCCPPDISCVPLEDLSEEGATPSGSQNPNLNHLPNVQCYQLPKSSPCNVEFPVSGACSQVFKNEISNSAEIYSGHNQLPGLQYGSLWS